MMDGLNKSEVKKEADQELGSANRYMNAGTEFKERINNEALKKVKQLMPVLQDLESDPKKFHFHDERLPHQAGWMGNYIFDFEKSELSPLYGMQIQYINDHYNPGVKVPQEVLTFLSRVQDLKNKYSQNPELFSI